ncbi:hypothetical protein IAD21_04026 [Abditibacteriota bacterium]|nr:hypothetical protein IAD21_04026 [Abditibacteriota bacterium]
MDKEQLNELSREVVNSAFEVHRKLGPGLLESVYEKALAYELRLRCFNVQTQVVLPVSYKGVDLEMDFWIDLLVEEELIIELKSIKELQDVHFKQTLTYLRLADKRLALLINFNVPLFRDGIKRVANNF